jgi:hypothetical protein
MEGGQLLPIRFKPFAVLAYLATRAGRLVPARELDLSGLEANDLTAYLDSLYLDGEFREDVNVSSRASCGT